MKISNFKYVGKFKTGNSPIPMEKAIVDVTTGCLWWKKTVKMIVFKDPFFWKFESNGKFCPGHDVEELESVYKAKCSTEKI